MDRTARPGAGGLLKRIFIGRSVSSAHLEHQLLPKSLALPVFSSDTLSSVAYATEEMMIVLATAGAAALSTMVPIGIAIGALLAVVVTSYRQTVRAYPQGGGSYIVTKENLGTLPGLLAAAAILADYVLTVAVSMTAGTIAVISAVPELDRFRVQIALGFVTLVTLANLRGVKEAGRLFAFPTYGFALCVAVTIVMGLVRCLGGCPQAASANLHLEAHAGLTLFIILRAFSSGASALTGVEAVADGVQAFRRPQSRNAATTLALMGVMATSMFLGITVLARALHVRVSEEVVGKSVLAQIGETVWGGGAMFYVLQVFTAAILFLAANTAYQDFPRLSAILARDRFMPAQFGNRGDRLVFSNGVIVLTVLAGLLIWVFEANLTRLIQLYVVGVFTAFTLSQSGMVRRWLKVRTEGWRRSMIINAIGAGTTGVVLVIVALTKFTHGAWIVIAAMPVIVSFFLWVHRHYRAVSRQLRRGAVRPDEVVANHVVLVVPAELDAATAEALGYVRSFRPTDLRAVHFAEGDRRADDLMAAWPDFSRGIAPLEVVPRGGRRLVRAAREYLRALPREPDSFVTMVIPELVTSKSVLGHLLGRWDLFRLKAGLLREPNIVVTDVPVHVEGGQALEVDALPLIPTRTVALVFMSSVHDATVRAVNYAMSLQAAKTRAVFFALEPAESGRVVEEWGDRRLPMELDVVEAPFRDLAPTLLAEVRSETAREDTVVSVVMPELIVKRWWHFFLHNQNALFIKRQLLFEPRVILSSVPFPLE